FEEASTFKTFAKYAFGLGADDPKKGGVAKILEELSRQIQAGFDRSIENTELREATDLLRKPVQMCRLIPGGRVPKGENKASPFTAPEGWRRLHAHDLLLFLAERTRLDHWYREDGTTPYYTDPALAYANAAEKLAEGKKEPAITAARAKQATNLVKHSRAPAVRKVEPSTPSPAPWTTENSC